MLFLATALSLAFICVVQGASKKVDNRQEELVGKSARKSIIHLDSAAYKEYVSTSPRNYSLVVMFTALDKKRGCSICKELYEEYKILADSWRFTSTFDGKLFFVLLDFEDASDVFSRLNLNMVPLIVYVPQKGPLKTSDGYNVGVAGMEAEAIAMWLKGKQGLKIQVIRPPNYGLLSAVLLITIPVLGLLYMKRENVEQFLNRQQAGIFSIAIIFMMLSGTMWNQIRFPAFSHRNSHTGEMIYIHPGNDAQLQAETIIVFFLYAFIFLGFYILNEIAAGMLETKKRSLFTTIGIAVLAVALSLFVSVFRRKLSYYPFKFLIA